MGEVSLLPFVGLAVLILCFMKHQINLITSLEDQQLVKQIFMSDELRKIDPAEPFMIIFLDYDSPFFREIDTFLAKEAKERFIVVFRGPHWLVHVKQRTWQHHFVADGRLFSHHYSDHIIQQCKSGKLLHYRKPKEFLDYYLTKKGYMRK